MALSATTGALTVLGSAPVAAAPGTGNAGDTTEGAGSPADDSATARALLDDTVVEAGRAVEEYNRVSERVGELTTEVERLRDRLARDRERVNRKREALGGIAGAQYRSGGMDPALALLLSPDPDAYLTGAAALERISGRGAEELRELRRLLRGMEQRREETAEAVGELEERRAELARRKEEVRRKLAGARIRLERLTAEEERERASRAGDRVEPASPAGEADGPVSGRAAAAVAAARSAVGRPYVWGANGPHGFDCSGLTQWAWSRAGASLPRTSQAQAAAGRRVDVARIQPGDVVVYRPDAGHVGLYVGGGRVVHAPYPGANVREDPLGMMPISAVVRP
ncbi:C40 family peptidase [Streptomyces calidiresistens]|uniref:C40 family peptidase n=1 Tax=Streptomyces calidiresistens TaxID=1485586 RepID=UPI002B1FA27F|nr:NlpC/P60 family protein [Streptomyces calidiresistens]